jgi:hypothetical protein
MKRDLYAEVSARIVAELEAGAAPWVKPWSATPGANTPCNAVSNRPYSGCNVVLLWMAQAAGYRAPRFLTFKQALELGGNVRKGEHGSKVYFVKQLQVRDQMADDETATRLVPTMRERPASHRSSISNGSRLFDRAVKENYGWPRRLRDLLADYTAPARSLTGGACAPGRPTHPSSALQSTGRHRR